MRPFRPGDEPAIARICLATADNGADATGQLDDDDILPELFALPYLARHPEFVRIVESDDGRPIGYIVGAPDSGDFESWFGSTWWPRNGERWPMPATFASRTDGMIGYGYSRGHGDILVSDAFPAHLHIDLLPEAQGAGWGRALIAELGSALRAAGVAGVHADVSKENEGALRFYPRVGFETVSEDERSVRFGLRLV